MDPRTVPLANVLRLNTDLLVNCLAEVTEDQARARVLPLLNSMAFLVAHLARMTFGS